MTNKTTLPDTPLGQAPLPHGSECFLPDAISGWVASLLLLACVLVTWPFAEMGLHDDWSYTYSAKVLAQTGHITYNGWAAFPLGLQLYAGALFIKLFGFSFSAVRAVDVVFGCLTAPLAHALLRRFGVRQGAAMAGTLTFVLSPLFIALTASFMSDIPSLFCLLACLYGCVRAVQARTDRAAAAWLLAAALGNLAGGTVRQIAWLGVLVMVPSTALYLRRRTNVLATGITAWAVSIVAIAAMLHWFNHQPYVAIEPLLAVKLSAVGLLFIAKSGFRAGCTIVLLLSPLLLAIAMHYPVRDRRARRMLLITLTATVLAVALPSMRHGGVRWFTMLVGDYLSAKGILDLPWLYGTAPDVIPRWMQALATAFAFSSAATCLLLYGRERTQWRERINNGIRGAVFALLVPFTAAYLLLVMTRAAVFDRYFLPILFVLILLLLLWVERRMDGRLSLVWLLPLALLAAWGVAGTHDLYAATRARLAAADELRSAGVPRTEFQAGFEYDAWTQLEATGHVNERRMRIPAGAYQPWAKPASVPEKCVIWFSDYTPSVHPRFVLSNVAGFCHPLAGLAPVHYRTWFAPHDHTIYLERAQ